MCEDGSDQGTGGGQAAQGKCVEREESYTRTLPTAAHKVEEEPAGASCEGGREPGPRVQAKGKGGAVCRVRSARQDLMPLKGRKVWMGTSSWMMGQLWSQAAWFSDLRFLSSMGHRIPLELSV